MKYIMKPIKIIVLLALMLSVASCGKDYLSPNLESLVNADIFYTTEAQLENGIINMYDGIQGVNSTSTNDNHAIQVEFYLTEMRSDNTRTKASEGEAAQFESYTIEATNGIVQDYYGSFYNIIYRSNIVLENLAVATDANRVKFEAEARFVRAYAYFNLVRLYGDIPLVDRVISAQDVDVQYTRVATSTIYDFIVADLQNAVDGLDNTYKTRASKAAAQGLLAKVNLTLGNYTDAQTLCEAVMQSGFSLEPNFEDVFYNENNNEIIFAIGYAAGGVDSQNFSAEWLNAVGRTSGVNYLTNDAKDALDTYGGNRGLDVSYRVDISQPTQHQVRKFIPNGEVDAHSGSDFEVSDPTAAGNDWIVLRYADVLLMHVEAIMAGGNETSVQAALNSFQDVRNRAGLTDMVTNITKEELLIERRVELAFENHRLFDLIRLNEAQSILSDFSAINNYGFTATDLLLPIPQREINLSTNPDFLQNPGY
jgi:hypothetical protein